MKAELTPVPGNNIIGWLALPAFLFLFIIIWLVFISGNTAPDEKVFSMLAPHISEGRTRFMKAIAFLGNHKFLIPANLLFIAFLIFRKKKWQAMTFGVVALGSLGMMSLLKNLIQRQRPPDQLVEGITNFSFPSGHAFMSIAFYGLLIWWPAAYLKNKWQRQIAISFLLFMILLIGFSRIYLRVHYTTDVIAGFCIGTIWLLFSLWLIGTIKNASRLVPKQ